MPDNSLENESSTVSRDSNTFQIDGGAQRGSNLFHSFREFSIPTGGAAAFTNVGMVDRIFGRITGGNSSQIDGLIRVNGGADLFLINPSGFVFGPNARLEVGSFIATTASDIRFNNGDIYSAIPANSTLLTSTVPTGLGFNNTAPISIRDEGHTIASSLSLPAVEEAPKTGLEVDPDNTIAFLGGGVFLDGGIVRSPGQIELASVQNGIVGINQASSVWSFNYDEVSQFGDIGLNRLSFIDASGPFGGQINLRGRNISLTDSSVVYTSRFLEGESDAYIRAVADVLFLDGEVLTNPLVFPGGSPPLTPVRFAPSIIFIDNFGPGIPGFIEVITQELSLVNGSSLTARSFANGDPGSIKVLADEVNLVGFNSASDSIVSVISANSFGTGSGTGAEGGRVVIDSDQLNLLDGAMITSSTFSPSDGGVVEITANNILVSGSTDSTLFPSQISTSTFQFSRFRNLGDAGEIDINTDTLRVINGGTLGSTTNNTGNAGIVNIQTNYLEIGGGFNGLNRRYSSLGSAALELSPELRDRFYDSGIQTGNAGTTSISTQRLVVRDGGFVTVDNIGRGDGGDLFIDAERISLRDGNILSSTVEGSGGNLSINADSILSERSTISAAAGRAGDGGNIEVQSDVVALLDDSQISANAELGSGGRVFVSTSGLFQDGSSSISASSAAGPQFDGTVTIQAPESGLDAATPDSPSFQAPQTRSVCSNQVASGRNEFVVAGRGGLPLSPNSLPSSYSGWQENEPGEAGSSTPTGPSATIVEAQGFSFHPDGSVSLVAVPDDFSPLDARLQAQGCIAAEHNS